ncbi:UNVERIFIED_CONTAM: hypothetical protein FKN15_036178 [Acipenser sinensis]
MDVSVSVSLFQDELASTIEHAVKAALHTVLCAITKAVGSKFTEFQVELARKEKENESLKLRLEISESELKAVRGCINAADADIKHALIFQDPKETHANSESEAQEGPKIEAVYTQEESFEQEWCASLMQVTELACVKDEEVPQQECVPIKEDFIEQECVPIAEELPHENHVCTLEENNKLGSNLCDDSPSECELGFRDLSNTLEESEEQEGALENTRALDLSNTVEESEEQEGALENKRALEAEDSCDSDAELDSDGLKGERELAHHYHYYFYYRHGYHCARCDYALLFLYTLAVGYIRTILNRKPNVIPYQFRTCGRPGQIWMELQERHRIVGISFITDAIHHNPSTGNIKTSL